MMQYKETADLSRRDAEHALSSTNASAVCDALVNLSFHDPDWKWVQNQCIKFAIHKNPEISAVAITCIGHLARIHKQIDKKRITKLFDKLKNDPELKGRVEDAISDIRTFVK